MKITKNQLRRIIKEERAKLLKEEPSDYYKDFKSGSISYEEYQQMVKDYERATGDGPYRSSSYTSSPRKTSYVGIDANADQIAAIEAALSAKPNKFLSSVLSQLQNGRGLSGKQKSIVKSIIKKNDPTAATLFESNANAEKKEVSQMKITKNQLRRIIKEEKAKLIKEAGYRHPGTGEDLFLVLNDVVDKLLDQGMDTMELANELRGLADDVEDSKPMAER